MKTTACRSSGPGLGLWGKEKEPVCFQWMPNLGFVTGDVGRDPRDCSCLPPARTRAEVVMSPFALEIKDICITSRPGGWQYINSTLCSFPYQSIVTAQAQALEMVCFGKLFMVSHKRTHTLCRQFEHLRKKTGILFSHNKRIKYIFVCVPPAPQKTHIGS